MSKVF